MNRRLFASALALGLIWAASARAEDTLNVGAYPTNPPFEVKQPDGTFQGFEVDVVNEAAKRAGFKTNIADYGFQALFAAIASKRIDVAISSITITPERLKSVSFTQPYYDSDMGLATKTDSPLKSVDDLKGKTVGYLSGSTGEAWVGANKGPKGFGDAKGYKSYSNMLLDLSSGRVDAVVSDIPGLQYAFKSMSDLTVKDRIKTGEQYGLMLPKDDANLTKLSDAIGSMKKDGALAAIHKKWFGVEPPAGSSTVTQEPIPK
jgi:polar amino acid transport system substrate-binding protein